MIKKRSINIAGHATSITLEQEFWDSLHDLAQQRKSPLNALIANIDTQRNPEQNLSSALRVYVLNHHKEIAKKEKE